MGQRKVDLIIVEGPSDETALAAPLSVVLSDGVYIPDEAVTFDESVSKTVYTDDGIVTTDPDGIRRRNEKKRRVLLTLRRRNDIGGEPYTVYFMSSNLDHVLYDKQNSTDQEKEDDAYEFAERYHEDPEGFMVCIITIMITVKRARKS